MEDSQWVKFALYVTFAVGCGVMVLRSSPGTSFATDPFRGMFYGIIRYKYGRWNR